MRRLKAIVFALLLMCGICAIGCGGSGDNNFGGGFNRVITSLAVSPKPVTRTVGQTQQFAATVTANDGSTGDVTGLVTWTSSNPAVVSVNASGLATANAAGSAVITASGAGFSDAVAFTVTGTGTAVNLIALNSSGSGLVRFTSTNPGNPTNVAVTGLEAGDVLVGIDVRPQNRFLYGLGFNSGAGTVRLYSINPDNGFATAVGTNPVSFVTGANVARPVTGTGFGFDFNPFVDRIRVVTNTGQNFRLNPNTGDAIDGGGNAGIQMDGDINGASVNVDAAAYTNNQPNTPFTTLYTLDSVTRQLAIQNAPDLGTQTLAQAITLNGNALNFTAVNGFDIPAGVNAPGASMAVTTGSGIAALTVSGSTNLYSINLVNGQATLLGIANANLSGLTILPDSPDQPALALSGTNLQRFAINAPTVMTTLGITGVAAGESLAGIDYRPATGQLFGLGINNNNTGTLYRIDPQTGAATIIGANSGLVTFAGTTFPDPATAGYGFDFNPAVDRIRVTAGGGGGLNFRINPNTGLGVGAVPDGVTNTMVNGVVPFIGGAAYTNSFGQTLTGGVTTLYTLDSAGDRLFIQNPPNDGTQSVPVNVLLNGATLDFTSINGFDIDRRVTVAANSAVANGSGTAVLNVAGNVGLYTINLTSGAATFVGTVGNGNLPIQGFTLGN